MSPTKRPAVISAVVVAAGKGERMGGEVPKPFLLLGGLPILCRTLVRLQNQILGLREIIVVVRPEDREGEAARWQKQIVAAGATSMVDGGPTRMESVEAGLAAVTEEADLILIHDAVRPFFPPVQAREACRVALRVGGAILAVRVRDTLKREAGENRVGETVNRTGLWQAQTPQVFKREVLLSAVKRARAVGLRVSDDAQFLEEAGLPVELVKGSVANFKITEKEDLELAEALFAMEMERD